MKQLPVFDRCLYMGRPATVMGQNGPDLIVRVEEWDEKSVLQLSKIFLLPLGTVACSKIGRWHGAVLAYPLHEITFENLDRDH